MTLAGGGSPCYTGAMAQPPASLGDKPPPKPRSSAPLAAAVALLLGIPLAGFALKAWGPLLFAPEEAPSPVVEITGPRRRSPPAAPAENRPSSLDMIRRASLGESRPAVPAPAAQAAPTPPAQPPAPEKPAIPVPPAQKPAPPAPKPYPKLKPNHGWLSWFARQPLQPTPDQEQDPNIQYTLPQTPRGTDAAAPAANVSPASAAAPPPQPKPARRGYTPPAPVYTVSSQATELAPGAGHGTLDVPASAPDRSAGKPIWTEHSTFVNPPDKAPEPNPEKPRTDDGACPRRGWWKSPYTGLCYYSHASCNASDYEHRGCFQPNP